MTRRRGERCRQCGQRRPAAAPPASKIEEALIALLDDLRPRVRDQSWLRWAESYRRGERGHPPARRQLRRLRPSVDVDDVVQLADAEAARARRLARACWNLAIAAVGVATGDLDLARAAMLTHLEWFATP